MPEDISPPFSLDSVRFDACGLVPVVAQAEDSREVLTLAYANREALQHTLTTKFAHYHSRSRGRLWKKGETSGNVQHVVAVVLDCDGDAVLYRVRQKGPACHKNETTCFHNPLFEDAAPAPTLGVTLERVYATIQERIRTLPEGSYVAGLHQAGLDRILKKIGEEAGEVIIAAKNNNPQELQPEASDLLFHLLFVMAEIGVSPQDVANELQRRQTK